MAEPGTHLFKGYIYAIPSNAALASTGTWSCGVAYVSPNIQGAEISHDAEPDKVRGQDGKYRGVLIDGEALTVEFTVIPEGTNIANAKISATVPCMGDCFATANFPVVSIGSFADGFNVSTNNAAVSNAVWVYLGGGRVRLSNTEKAQVTLPLWRAPGLNSATKITS